MFSSQDVKNVMEVVLWLRKELRFPVENATKEIKSAQNATEAVLTLFLINLVINAKVEDGVVSIKVAKAIEAQAVVLHDQQNIIFNKYYLIYFIEYQLVIF